YCRLDYPEYEIIFAVAEPDDPVVPVIERLQSDFPDCPIRLVKGVARVGANRKVNSLCRLVHEAKYDLVVMSDSDVRVEPDYLRVATAPLSDSEVGFFFQAEDGIRDGHVTGVQTCALPISARSRPARTAATSRRAARRS